MCILFTLKDHLVVSYKFLTEYCKKKYIRNNIDKLISSLLSKSTESKACCRCLDETEYKTLCNHHYHPECLKEYILQDENHCSCPMCNKSFLV